MSVSIIVSSVSVSGDVAITGLNRPCSYRVEVSGSGSAGTLQVDSRYTLVLDRDETVLRYSLAIETTGALGMLGRPVIEPAVRLILGQFFGALGRELDHTRSREAGIATAP